MFHDRESNVLTGLHCDIAGKMLVLLDEKHWLREGAGYGRVHLPFLRLEKEASVGNRLSRLHFEVAIN